ncbi:alpha/beta hydrolase family protein [Reinekea marinisedimentorum]|nr:acetylxylan esterase [Reinekea marinisedimentorum]
MLIVIFSSFIVGCNVASFNEADNTEVTSIELTLENAEEEVAYSANLYDYVAYDTRLTELDLSMNNAPDWLSIDTDGNLYGTPTETDIGDYSWQINLNDNYTATASLTVLSREGALVVALGELTEAPDVFDENGDELAIDTSSGELQAIFFDALDYEGNSTRAYAWIGIPADITTPVPAMVLVHGGGGTAYSDWVEEWNERGYAAISIAVEGQTDEASSTGGWSKHEWAGPSRSGIYNDANPERSSLYVDVPDQWMYHAVADTILANSLLRSIDVIDADKIGVMGISWGGVITSTVMGLDDRFALAIPVYGCGHLYDAENWWSNTLSYNTLYKEVWDPMVRMDNATMPSLWLSWSGDNNFGMDSFAYSYEAAAGDHMVSLIPDMGHGHGAGWNPSDSYEFAESIFSTGISWFEQISLSEDAQPGDDVSMNFISTKELTSYSLRYTTGTGFTGDLDWLDETATLTESIDGSYSIDATLPDGTTGWYFSLTDDDVYASSDYSEIIHLFTSPEQELQLQVAGGDSTASGEIELSFTGPTNIDIQKMEFNGSDYADAFSVDLEPEIELDADYPTETLTVTFDNSVAELESGSSVTATLTFTWEHLDGGSDSLDLFVTATIAQ